MRKGGNLFFYRGLILKEGPREDCSNIRGWKKERKKVFLYIQGGKKLS